MVPTILLLSTADTELLAARASGAAYLTANPARLDPMSALDLASRADVVVLRLLGGRQAWPAGVDALVAAAAGAAAAGAAAAAGPTGSARRPLVALGGDAVPDAELMALSTVPAGVATDALAYLREGGPENLRAMAAFLSDTLLLTGEGFDPPRPMPVYGSPHPPPLPPSRPLPPSLGGRPVVAVVYYRAHELAGNAAFVDTLCDAITAAGGTPLQVFAGSLRQADEGLLDLLKPADAVITTVLAAGGTSPAVAGSGSGSGSGDGDWDAGILARLDVPILQGLCLTNSRTQWDESDAAISPVDAAMQVAIPEFDGRLITVPFSFKETGPDGIGVYVADPERARRLAGIAVRHARLRSKPNQDKRIVIMLSSYPTKHARVGNAVGLDTPASAVRLLQAMREAGYDTGDGFPESGDELIHTLIAAGGHDVEWLTEEQLSAAPARVPLHLYRRWFSDIPNGRAPSLTEHPIIKHWGEPPGELYVDGSDIVLASLRFGNVVLMIQPPRGFGENPVAIYHDPDLPPSHHYLAAYRWISEEFGADAIVHLGKHGTMEWLPGKGLGLSADCFPDIVQGDLPLVYPFIVNDPGEGTQAKRRGHAIIVDHLVPPMARAESYGDMARLEQLLDEYATVQALDPDKLPAIRARIWSLVHTASLHHDLGVSAEPSAVEFDHFVLHIDGYLCEIKDAAIRDGLHILGEAPSGEALLNLVLVILRSPQLWSARWGAIPGLRAALGYAEGAPPAPAPASAPAPAHDRGAFGVDSAQKAPRSRVEADRAEALARELIEATAEAGWDTSRATEIATRVLTPSMIMGRSDQIEVETAHDHEIQSALPMRAGEVADVARVLEFACVEVVPRLNATTGETGAVLHALDGGYVPAGPSGSPTRGLVNVLPTGRNFYSVDPKAIPSLTSWETGHALAESLIARHLRDEGDYPRCVGLTVWGTSAMRTQGDDIAEVLALLGCRPVWDEASRRVTGFSVVPPAELGRPRIDVTLRISGFFRDAFPHVIGLLDDAITAVAELDEPVGQNYVRAHALADHAVHGDWQRATTRIFGSKPGAYGAGLLPLIDARNWRDDADLAEVYAVWGGYAYSRSVYGSPARADMEAAYGRITVAAKNTDTREHDIADSDDYFQYHGGMVAMVRALTGRNPAAYIGDSAVPDAVQTRTLAEETRRVFRSRVVNPKWIAAMRRHGYKGAFELAATVDYLFGYDATAGVVQDWMYEQLAASYVFDEENRAFMERSNPWALRGITERLLEAADRGLWEAPDQKTLDQLRQVYLDMEGDLEAAAGSADE
jgi:cobaltochelatase CobN